eukprot:2020734-Alexandrium_andersonii.AAC.1
MDHVMRGIPNPAFCIPTSECPEQMLRPPRCALTCGMKHVMQLSYTTLGPSAAGCPAAGCKKLRWGGGAPTWGRGGEH